MFYVALASSNKTLFWTGARGRIAVLYLDGSLTMDNYAKDGDQGRSDLYVVFTMILCTYNAFVDCNRVTQRF